VKRAVEKLICYRTSQPSCFQWKRNELVNQHCLAWISGYRANPRSFLGRRDFSRRDCNRNRGFAGGVRGNRLHDIYCNEEYRYLSIILMAMLRPWLRGLTTSYCREQIEREQRSSSRSSSWRNDYPKCLLSYPSLWFRNTVTCESCYKLIDWNSVSRYNGYSLPIDWLWLIRARAHVNA